MKGFISYSHDNAAQMRALARHLYILEESHGLKFWWDKSNHAGAKFDAVIEGEIAAADVGLVLASTDSLRSWYIREREIPALRAAEKARGTLIVPLVLDYCIYERWFPKEVAIPLREGRPLPVMKWNPRDPAYYESCMALVEAVTAHTGKKPRRGFRGRA